MPLRYHPYHELGEQPSIIVDGTPHPAQALILSHWKGSGTAAELLRDTSAEIVSNFILNYEIPKDVELVSNDHFDEDGLISVYLLTQESLSKKDHERLVDIAEAGDFGRFKDRDNARVCFALSKMLEKETGLIPANIFSKPYPEIAAASYRFALDQLPQLLTNLDDFEQYWSEEDAFLTFTEQAFDKGDLSIEELPRHDLAVLSIPESFQFKGFHRFTQTRRGSLHDMAVHNRTQRSQIIYRRGRHYQFKYRYESWVQVVSRKPPLRVDLQGLAKELTDLEEKARWTFTGASRITPVLHTIDHIASKLSFETFLDKLCQTLERSPVAWDPYEA